MVLDGARILRIALLAAVVVMLGGLVRGLSPGVVSLPGDGNLPGGDETRGGGLPFAAGFKEGILAIESVPAAGAILEGGPLAPEITGEVWFFPSEPGTTVAVRVNGLPEYRPGGEGQEPIGPHGFHIHEFGTCEIGDPEDPFLAAGGHWNPAGDRHGDHPGDFPVIFSNLGPRGFGLMTFFTDEFKPADVVGLSVVIHLHPNDYRTQPAGASGPRLACGVIEPVG